jgi:hypothetical protein
MKEYYVLSIKRTEGYVLTWYRPKAQGYTIYLESAGKFTEEEVEESGYNNGEVTLAVLCELADEASYRCVPWEGKALTQMGISGAFKNA